MSRARTGSLGPNRTVMKLGNVVQLCTGKTVTTCGEFSLRQCFGAPKRTNKDVERLSYLRIFVTCDEYLYMWQKLAWNLLSL